MKISFGNMTVELNVFDVSKQPPDNDDVCEVDMIESDREHLDAISF